MEQMDEDFIRRLLRQQESTEKVPSNKVITSWAEDLICLLYPEKATCTYQNLEQIRQVFANLRQRLFDILNETSVGADCQKVDVVNGFFAQVPEIYRLLNTDVRAIVDGDPAARSEFEVIRAYPGFYALSFYRIAHALHLLDIPLIPRILTEHAHSVTGIDIHPAAVIGEHCFIDHGTGIVVGESAIIGKHVKLYQGVTIGALSVDKEMARTKRHPTIEDHVVIYSGASILGGDTVIGSHSVIGGNVWLTRSVPAGSLVYHNPEITVLEGKLLNP